MNTYRIVSKIRISTFLLLATLAFLDVALAQHEHGHGAKHSAEPVRGPHHGRMLTKGDFSVELQIFETGVAPQYRIYGYHRDHALVPTDFTASVSLKRLGKESEQFIFKPVADFLTSDTVVSEPHSFDVEVKAEYKGEMFSWKFDSYEGRTEIPDQVAERSGIKTEQAQTRLIKTVLKTRGKVLPSEHKIAHIIPRFSGIVREGRKHIGDRVEKGEVLATIESNQSLQPFEVRSQIAGTVINGHLIMGEFVPDNQWIYIVADLSEVWVDFFVPLKEQQKLKIGQNVMITSVNDKRITEGSVSYVAPYADERSQSQLIRAIINNRDGEFLPGMFVTGDLVIDVTQVHVAIKKEALQKFRDWDVVFAKVGSIYEIKPLTLGKTDGEWVEVLEGLRLGEEYVTQNSYLIKADILKSGASHDH
jgi:cobalt-zinc-cadmium efflux system membrane fusion protein